MSDKRSCSWEGNGQRDGQARGGLGEGAGLLAGEALYSKTKRKRSGVSSGIRLGFKFQLPHLTS